MDKEIKRFEGLLEFKEIFIPTELKDGVFKNHLAIQNLISLLYEQDLDDIEPSNVFLIDAHLRGDIS